MITKFVREHSALVKIVSCLLVFGAVALEVTLRKITGADVLLHFSFAFFGSLVIAQINLEKNPPLR